jgi:hypothetical protein
MQHPGSEITRTIKFNQNWNEKLNCRAFTTIRAPAEGHQVGNNYRVLLKGQKLGVAEVKSIRQFRLHELTDGCALLDTGYLADQAISLVRQLNYRYINKQGNEAYFNWLVLQYVSKRSPGLLVD